LANTEPPVSPPDDLPLNDPAFMLYTSGTTGRPKGVLLSQQSNLWVVAACWAPIVGYSADDYILSPLPLFHSFALNAAVLATIAVGATEYVMSRFSTTEVLRLLREEPITLLLGVPTMFQYLLQEAGDEGLGVEGLRVCVSAGAIMTADLNQAFEDAFEVPLLDGYGITETSTMVTQNWSTGTRLMGYCGLPLPGSSVRIVDPGTEADVSTGEEGELWVRGPHVMLKYHDLPEETDNVLHHGWYHTGDLACSNEHGYIKITGRIKELIIRGGENIAPVEVEEVVAQHPAVADCAVVGVPHESLGEVPVVFVVPEDEVELEPDDLLDYCSEHLARYKVPDKVMVTNAIPRTGSGKTMRFKLQEQLSHESST
jgi:acyl-CoA synthetase (AMP-forming)/AMP-acid ligase II